MQTPSPRYYVRQQKSHVSGPYSMEQLRELIESGRIRPDMEFSVDRRDWAYGLELVELFPPAWCRRKLASWYAETPRRGRQRGRAEPRRRARLWPPAFGVTTTTTGVTG